MAIRHAVRTGVNRVAKREETRASRVAKLKPRKPPLVIGSGGRYAKWFAPSGGAAEDTTMAGRMPIVGGNWKMNMDLASGGELAEEIAAGCADLIAANDIRIAIHPHAAVVQDGHREEGALTPDKSAPLARVWVRR